MDSREYEVPAGFLRRTEDVKKLLHKQGFLIVNGYFKRTMTSLNKDANKILDDPKTERDYLLGKYCVLSPNRPADLRFPAIDKTLLCNSILNRIAQTWLGEKAQLHKDIVVSHEFRSGTRTQPENAFLHFDTDHALKFMIYLKDVGRRDGPFSIIPNSRELGYKLRHKERSKKNKFNQIRDFTNLRFTEDKKTEQCTHITGPAGTLIIFDTDTLHYGGVLDSSEGERKIMRSNCMSRKPGGF